jgi:multidrug efflux pump subunit AcrB
MSCALSGAIVIGVFLFHARSALVAAITLPVATISSFIAFYYLDISINVMSLAGIILALGDMVDSRAADPRRIRRHSLLSSRTLTGTRPNPSARIVDADYPATAPESG